jgi:hypothetical protein
MVRGKGKDIKTPADRLQREKGVLAGLPWLLP